MFCALLPQLAREAVVIEAAPALLGSPAAAEFAAGTNQYSL